MSGVNCIREFLKNLKLSATGKVRKVLVKSDLHRSFYDMNINLAKKLWEEQPLLGELFAVRLV